MGQTGKWQRMWPQIRAALVAIHVLAIVLLSFPGSSKLGDRSRWKEERTQSQIAQWGARLRSWGFDVSDEELEADLWDFAQGYLRARTRVTAPVEPYEQIAPQSWGMFKAPQLDPSAIAVDIEDADGWRTVYESRSSEHDYLSRLLDNNRFRKQIGQVGYDKLLFKDIARWIAERAFVDFPEAQHVRVRVERLTALPPAERSSGAEVPHRTESEHVFARGHQL